MLKPAIYHYKTSHADYLAESHSPILSAEEQLRAVRFINERDRVRYIGAHRFLRLTLAKYLNAAPHKIEFEVGGFGKPFIASPSTTLHFNFSRRGDCALLAVADCEVGIDVEQIRNIDDVDAFCSNYFHANERAIINASTTDQLLNTIFTFWAFKEAFIKCLGIGFSRDLTEFDLSAFYHLPTHALPSLNGDIFTIERMKTDEGFVGAVAYKN